MGRSVRSRRCLWFAGILVPALCCLQPALSSARAADASAETPTQKQIQFFETKVRPLLAEHCLSCHGAKKQEAGLRLDSRLAILKGSDYGRVVVAGDPKASRLMTALEYGDSALQMPPDEALPAEAVAHVRTWIQEGLPWPAGDADSEQAPGPSADPRAHWAFQPIDGPAVPDVQQNDICRTAVDRFIQSRLEGAGLTLSPEADRRTLIRRATFDLTGLPPTPEEVDDFLNDASPHAWERLIDRLLDSPRYGERWGRHWLDVARYADNKGYVFFEEKNYAWSFTYRDYVVNAFNADLPYHQFIREQLAADLLVERGEADRAALPAMGFLTLGGRFMNNVHDIMDDRIDVVTRGLMGLTVTCARCHDHKFDPFSQADYYALYGVFRSALEPLIPPTFTDLPDSAEARAFSAELQGRVGKLDDFVARKHAALVLDARRRAADYLLAVARRRQQPSTENFMLLTPSGDLNPTMIRRWEQYLSREKGRASRIWSLWHALVEIPEERVTDEAARRLAEGHDSASAGDASRAGLDMHPSIREHFQEQPPTSLKDLALGYAHVLQQVDVEWNRLLLTAEEAGDPPPVSLADPLQEELRLVFYGADAPPQAPQVLGWGFLDLFPDRESQAEFKKLLKEVETWINTAPNAPPRAMVLNENASPFRPRIFLRGNPGRPGDFVERRFLSILGGETQPFNNEGSGRLELANAIASPENPLTARVLVNRVWSHHFGKGLVATASDFGRQGEHPTHPELLDWLARRFMEQGWSIKQLHRTIMHSAAYRQQSLDRPEARRVDPENALLWRMNRQRLDFESTRDALLAVSNRLATEMGGKPLPLFGKTPHHRRTLYAYIDRLDLPSLWRTFDFPSPDATSPGRTLTTIPPQALFLMNHNFAIAAAAGVCERQDVQSLSDATARLHRITRILYGRDAMLQEQELAAAFLGDQPSAQDWQRLVHALLMTNEFVFVD